MDPPDITSRFGSSPARALARGELSATEIVAAHVARINELNPRSTRSFSWHSSRGWRKLEFWTLIHPLRRIRPFAGCPSR